MTNTNISLFCLCIAFVCTSMTAAFGQTYSITGTVSQQENGQPIVDADIFIENTTVITKTNRKGQYTINKLRPGTYRVSAFFLGTQNVTQAVTITNANVTLNFELAALSQELEEVTIEDEQVQTFSIKRLRSVEGTAIYESKKSEVVVVDQVVANLATNNQRQVYARVPGLNIWESDGAGLQMGIGGRGLSPNRNANFNTRQNGYDIAADALGYPESYYTPPTQAVNRIEIVRGAASLQYGTQFGGMLNFKLKDHIGSKPFSVQAIQSVGSFGLVNSYNSVGGATEKVKYYAYYQYKRSDGWRPNSGLDQHAAYGAAQFKLTPKLSIKPEYTFMYYLAQQPGGLTDAQFADDPQQSNRERNWFRVNWNLMAVTADYRFSDRTKLNTRFFGLLGGRDALGNLDRIDRLDFGDNRDLLVDDFRNWGNETRLIHNYTFKGNTSVFLGGVRYYSGYTDRKQGDGNDGNTGNDSDFEYLNPDLLEGSDFDLPSRNVSVFAENIFNLSERVSITPGIRFEYIDTRADGYYRNIVRDLAGNILIDDTIEEERENTRSFVFFGIGASYKPSDQLEVYGNFSQNYRAINFNDIRVNVGSLEVDPNIDDERGFNIDLGIRGDVSGLLNYDVSVFHLAYNDRIGTVLRTEPNPAFNNLVDRTFRYRTNVADADIFGMEAFAEVDLIKAFINRASQNQLSLFTNVALIDATYAESEENGIEGNEVELVPSVNVKAGLTYRKGNFAAAYQVSYVGEHFSDATNAVQTPTAIEGIIPAYHVMDLSLQYSLKRYRFEGGINNLSDQRYFTRRATGYPGPGIIPSVARNYYITVGIEL